MIGDNRDIKRGDVWYVESGYSTGSEQRPGRPAVIVSNDKNNRFSQCVEVVYLTTQPKKDLPTHASVFSVGRGSTAICEQITSVAIERITTYKGHVTAEEMEDIENAMLISLDLKGLVDFQSEMCGSEVEPEPEDTPEPVATKNDAEMAARLMEAEAKCAVLQRMYDELLGKLLKVSVGVA